MSLNCSCDTAVDRSCNEVDVLNSIDSDRNFNFVMTANCSNLLRLPPERRTAAAAAAAAVVANLLARM